MKNELKSIPRSELEKLIDEWILNERDRKVIKRRLLDGIRYDKLSEEFDLSERRLKEIVYNSENILLTKVAYK